MEDAVELRPLDRCPLPYNHHASTLQYIHELRGARTGVAMNEWMYELEEGKKNDPHARYRSIFSKVCKREKDVKAELQSFVFEHPDDQAARCLLEHCDDQRHTMSTPTTTRQQQPSPYTHTLLT